MELGAVPVKKEGEFWFARRFPLGDPRQAYGPVHWKGWASVFVFIAAIMAGAVYFAWDAMIEQNFIQGLAVFLVAGFVGTAWYMLVVRANCDTLNTVADYRKGKPRV